jgi:hypothetical protein
MPLAIVGKYLAGAPVHARKQQRVGPFFNGPISLTLLYTRSRARLSF